MRKELNSNFGHLNNHREISLPFFVAKEISDRLIAVNEILLSMELNPSMIDVTSQIAFSIGALKYYLTEDNKDVDK